MKIETRHFGEIDVDESKVITFADGIPGFLHCKRFILIENESTDDSGSGLLWWLQSLDDGDIAFVLMDVYNVMPDYSPVIEQDDLTDLGECDTEDYLVYNIAVIPENVKEARVNLRAPVVINTLTSRGKQVVATNEEYAVRFMIFEEMNRDRV